MKQRILLITTLFEGLHPLAYQGVQASSCYAQFTSLLSGTELALYAAVFAEPLADSKRGCIDWYTQAEAAPRPFASLSPEEQQSIQNRLQDIFSRISRLAEELAAKSDSNSRMAGNLLAYAVSFPNDSCIYDVDGEPVVICWAYAKDSIVTIPQEPVAEEAVETPPPPMPPVKKSFPWRWLLYALFSFFGILILLALLNYAIPLLGKKDSNGTVSTPTESPSDAGTSPTPDGGSGSAPSAVDDGSWSFLPSGCSNILPSGCTVALPSGCTNMLPSSCASMLPSGCTGDAVTVPLPVLNATMQQSLDATADLQLELNTLRAEYLQKLALCPPPMEKSPLPEPEEEAAPERLPDPFPLASADDLLDDPLVNPEVEPVEEPVEKPKPQAEATPQPKEKPKPPQKDTLEIPDDAKDLDFLDGCWYADLGEGLTSTRSGLPVAVKFCFSGKGKGLALVQEFDSRGKLLRECKGSLSASLGKSKLTIKDGGSVRCPDGGKYRRNVIDCRSTKGAALCSDVTGDDRFKNVRFKRTDRYSAPKKGKK